MEREKLETLLNKLADTTTEPVRPALAEDIKYHIPHTLTPHRVGSRPINIIIDLRISKLAAAAVIIVTMILFAGFFGGREAGGGGVYRDYKILAKYWLGDESVGEDGPSAISKFYSALVQQGKDVQFYGDRIGPQDKETVWLHWRLDDGSYRVIFADLHAITVSADELIKLQARMLQSRKK